MREAVKATKSKMGNYDKIKNIRKRLVKNRPEANIAENRKRIVYRSLDGHLRVRLSHIPLFLFVY
jgi:hypothetical protein